MTRVPNGGNRLPVRDVYVARTVVAPQPGFERFLERLGRRLGRSALVTGIGSAHLTYLEGAGSVRQAFRRHRFTPDDVKRFRGQLQAHISEENPALPLPVEVDGEQPLVWLGGRRNTLAIRIMPSDELAAERQLIEDFLGLHFDGLPPLKPFEPHITLANRVEGSFLEPCHRSRPELLLPPGLQVPEVIALNGLMTYLDRISDQ